MFLSAVQGGSGKTTLGGAVASEWEGDVFWYTFRPNLNDNLNSLLFTLGHFIQQHTSSVLWLQLMANRGSTMDRALLMGLLRGDLAKLNSDSMPLLIFDEVDLLHTAESNPRSQAHSEVLELLEALCAETSVLLIGQRAYIDTPHHIALTPFDVGVTRQLLAELDLSAQLTERIHRYTRGVPRMIMLVQALLRSGDDPQQLFSLHAHAFARPLFHRLWRRLERGEQELLAALSVFRSHVPANAWTEHEAALASLENRQVLIRDTNEGVMLLPFIRALVYDELRPEQRETLHAQAARLRTTHGSYTAAAYHYWMSDSPEAAVAVWYPHRHIEIRRGHSRSALDIFGQISANRLKGTSRKQLKLLQNELYLLAGQAERVVQGMAQYTWEVDESLAATAYYQWGEAELALGRFENALEQYGKSVTIYAQHTKEMAQGLFRRAQAQIGQVELQAAHTEAAHAQFIVQRLNGFLQLNSGNYHIAEKHLKEALATAEQLEISAETAGIHHLLCACYGRISVTETAQLHADAAIQLYRSLGNRLMVESVRADVAGIYLNVRQFDKVITASERALQFFEQINHSPRLASLCNHLAEAYLETGNLDKAKQFALRVLRLEEQRSLPYALYTLSMVHKHEGNLDLAKAAIERGINIARLNNDRFIETYLRQIEL